MPIYKSKKPGKLRVVVWVRGRAIERIVDDNMALAQKVEAAIREQAVAKRPQPVRVIRNKRGAQMLEVGKKWTRPFVYFVSRRGDSGSFIKIGYTKDIDARMNALQCASVERLLLLGTLPGGRLLEQALHRAFEHLRVDREWFRPDDEMYQMLRELFFTDEELQEDEAARE